MCEAELKSKYEALAQGRSILESCLHSNLSEHINSEIGLGTIRDIDSAKNWLRNSFLYQRIQQNPRHYAIGKAGNQTWQQRVDDMVADSIKNLQESELVTASGHDDSQLASTEYGDIMSKVRVIRSLLEFSHALYAVLHPPVDSTFRDLHTCVSCTFTSCMSDEYSFEAA